jgi:membrane protein DedA with SNARE-associated domain
VANATDGPWPAFARQERAATRAKPVNSAITALLHFSNHDLSWMAQFFTLVILPFAHEDLAIILGAYLVVNNVMPVGTVVLCIYAGMVVSDFALYFIGAGARRVPWLSRWAVDDRVRNAAASLQRNLFGLVALCRAVPGVVFIGIIACGWTRVPLGRFAVASLVVSAFYLPLMLYLAVVFGDALDDHVGWWAWPALALGLAVVDLARRRIFSFQGGETLADVPGSDLRNAPALKASARKTALAERIPLPLFYLPLTVTWLRFAWRYRSLTLPSVANPLFPNGGRQEEGISDYLGDIAANERGTIAEFIVFARGFGHRTLDDDLARLRQSLTEAGLTFPLVAKPDIGLRRQRVRRLDDLQALRDYLRTFPGGARLLLQRFVPLPGEASVLYARLPGATSGRILSLTFHHFPYVIGDGKASVRELIRRDKRAHLKARVQLGDAGHEPPPDAALDRVPPCGEVVGIAVNGRNSGAQRRDVCRHITAALEARFDAIAMGMSEFHYGRFDLRFGSVEELKRGENFAIVRISGVGAEDVDAWDPQLPLAELYRRLVDQQRIMFLIGEKNRARGFKPAGLGNFLKIIARRSPLARRYPASA